MPANQFRDFAELYRAAFAEADAERKRILLREVSKAIERSIEEPREEFSIRTEAA